MSQSVVRKEPGPFSEHENVRANAHTRSSAH